MARKPKIQTRVERDTKDAIDAYTEDHNDLSQSEAIRHLIRAGLAEKGYPVAAADGGDRDLLERIGSAKTVTLAAAILAMSTLLLELAYILFQANNPTLAIGAFILATVAVVVAATLITLAALAQLALARPLKGLVGLTTEEKA